MATTTNYSWTTPDDTALVKDGAAAIRTLGSAIDTTTKALNPSTTLGDIEYRSSTANTNTRLGIGTTGQVLTVSGGVPSWQTPSSGINWTPRLQNGTSNLFTKIEYNGSNLWVAVGASGQLYTSTNGQTWTSRTSGFGSNTIQDVAFGNGLWVAVGTNGTITTSTDGTTWTARTSNMSTNTINAVTYANSLWVAVGNGGGATNTGGITYSSDGLTWTRKSQTLTIGTSYNDIVWNGTNWIVAASISTNNYLYASTPSGTWTAGATGSGNNITAIYWDGTRHITNEGAATLRFSTSTTLGTTTAYATSFFNFAINSSYYYNNSLYATNGYYIQSILTAPGTSNYTQFNGPPTIAPGTKLNNTTPFLTSSTGSTNNSTIWVGANGYIFADGDGTIYSTF